MENPIELETEELRRFREEWRQEVEGRLEHESSNARSPSSPGPSTGASIHNTIENQNEGRAMYMDMRSATALELYTQAVKLEADGKLDAATALYRRAFRLQEDIDKIHYRSSMVADLKVRDLSRDVDALSLAQRLPVLKGTCTCMWKEQC